MVFFQIFKNKGRGNLMKKLLAVALVVLLGAVFFISTVHAETTFNYGASERIRQEIWDNVIDLKTLPPI